MNVLLDTADKHQRLKQSLYLAEPNLSLYLTLSIVVASVQLVTHVAVRFILTAVGVHATCGICCYKGLHGTGRHGDLNVKTKFCVLSAFHFMQKQPLPANPVPKDATLVRALHNFH